MAEAAIRLERLANVSNQDYSGLSSAPTPAAVKAEHETFAANHLNFRSCCC